jgi:hypothetical protein
MMQLHRGESVETFETVWSEAIGEEQFAGIEIGVTGKGSIT